MHNNNKKITPQMQLFLENLLIDAGLKFTDESAKQKIIEDLYFKLDEFLGVVIEENLSDDDLVEYFSLRVANTNAETLEKFLKAKIPNFDDLIPRAMLDFRNIYLSSLN